MARGRRLFTVLAGCALFMASGPDRAAAQADAPTTVAVTGGAQAASQQVPVGQTTFGIRVPLRPNAENVLSIVGSDTLGRSTTPEELRIAQISLTEVVRARVTAQRLTTEEVRQLVADGTIDVADPANYNVSRFVVALVVGGREVQVPMPVVRKKEEPLGFGESVSIGCAAPGRGLSTTDRAIAIPCGDGPSNGTPPPPIVITPFEIAVEEPGMPGIPGVIIIEGRIKTLKEFFKVDLLLMNVSSIFTLQDLTARLELPAAALSGVAPAGGSIVLSDIGPGSETTGQFIIRGDEKGTHTVTAHFGGVITGPFLPQPVPFSGSASTDLVVKGPPRLDVKLTHPDYVVAGEPYELRVEVRNTDTELDALYTSMEIDVGGDADLIDEVTGLETPGPSVRTLGDILRGESIVQTYRVMPRVSGPITSCVGAADANVQLTVAFTGPGRDPRCAIGTLPSERLQTDGRPTVTVVPAHNTDGVDVDPAMVAIFSQRMIEATITYGYPSATINVLDRDGRIVAATMTFTELFGATTAILRPAQPLAFGTEYTIVVNPNAFNEGGLLMASGIVARFTTEGAPYVPDTIAPTLSLALEAPFDTQPVARGQSPVVVVDAADNVGVVRVDLLLDGQLIDTGRPNSPIRFSVDTSALQAGQAYELTAVAFDALGNAASERRTLTLAPDVLPPTASITASSQVALGRPLPLEVVATDDGRIARVDIFVDASPAAAATRLVAPFQFAIDTAALAPGAHVVRAVVVDGAGNSTEAQHSFDVLSDTTPPIITVLSPLTPRVRQGAPVAVLASAIDDTGVGSVSYRLNGSLTPIASGTNGFTLDTSPLAPGAHVITVLATDLAGNTTSGLIPIEIFVPAPDTTPPAPVTAALVVVTTPVGGLASVTALDGAAEAGATVTLTNLTTGRDRVLVVGPTGAFAVQIEAVGGETLRIVQMDEAGNVSLPLTIGVPVPATLTGLSVTPSTVALTRTQTSQQIAVVGIYSDGSTQPMTSGLTFQSSAPAVASVTATGLVIAGRDGDAVIRVGVSGGAGPDGIPGNTDDELPVPGVQSADVPVTVRLATVTALEVSPNPVSLDGPGQTRTLTVQARYSDGGTSAFSGVVRFATGNPAVAIVDGAGRVTSMGVGSTIVTISSTGLPSVQILVTVAPVTETELFLEPATIALTDIGQTQVVTARARFSNGATGTPAGPVTYEVANTLVATVSASGVVTAVGEGTTTVVARSGAFVANAPISVVLPTTMPAPEITALGRPVAGETDQVVIAGRHFSGLPQGNAVTIGGLQAPVIGAAHDRLVVTVPRGAQSGPVQVVVGGQVSNTLDLQVYPRVAAAVLHSAPFAPPAPGTSHVDLGSAVVWTHAGDRWLLTADPNTIGASGWSGLFGPTFVGTLVVTIDGVSHEFVASPDPIDISSLIDVPGAPRAVTVQMRVEDRGTGLSSGGLAMVAGPAGTGAFIGERYTTGDSVADTVTLRFRVNAPDGTLFAATAVPWYRASDGQWNNGSAGGTVVGGVPTPNDSQFRTFVASGGEVEVTYADTGVLLRMFESVTAVVALLPANASGRIGTRPIVEARVKVGGLHSATVVPDAVASVADGVDRPNGVSINSVRDIHGRAVIEGSKIAVTAKLWYRRSDGGYHNGSSGGTVRGGVATPNDGDFRTVALANGEARFSYSSIPLVLDAVTTGSAVLAAVAARDDDRYYDYRPFAEGRVMVSAGGAGAGSGTAMPATLSATASDNRSVITLSGITDSSGRLVPDGTKVAVTAGPWYRQSDGGWSNGSFGGTILGGDATPNNGAFRTFSVIGGQVTFTYSNAGIVLGPFETATTVVAVLPADGLGRHIGVRPFAEVRIPQGGLTSAIVTIDPMSTIADGTRRPIEVSMTGIRDALGNLVPDGTTIAVTAIEWYRRSDGGYSNGSAGGLVLEGEPAANNGHFKLLSTSGAAARFTYSAESVPPITSAVVRAAVIAAVAADSTNLRVFRPFAEGAIALSSIATGTIAAAPTTLLADGQGRTAQVTVTGLVDAQGRPVPDGTRVAIGAVEWYRVSDGGYSNSSVGGVMLGGTPAPNQGQFHSYEVVGGAVTATYSASSLVTAVGATRPAVLSVMPATGNGSLIGLRPFLATTVSLVGFDSATVSAPSEGAPGSTVTVTLTNIRDAAGNVVPDGAKVAATAALWYTRSGSFGNGSSGGTIGGGVITPNHGNFRTFVVSGGQVSFSLALPSSGTAVVSVLPADAAGNATGNPPFATANVRVQ